MKLFSKIVLASLLVAGLNHQADAQVKFKLDQQEDKSYVFSLVSEKDYTDDSKNMVGTIQVTFKVPKGSDFTMSSLSSLIPDAEWMRNSVIENDPISPKYNFYSFGVMPLGKKISLKKDKEIALFKFKNAGSAEAEVEIINNTDPEVMAVENKLYLDIANNITIMTPFGMSNGYIGNLLSKKDQVSVELMYPNPTRDQVRVVWNNSVTSLPESLELLIVNAQTSAVMVRKPLSIQKGRQEITLSVAGLDEGLYVVKIERDKQFPSKSHRLMISQQD